MKKQLLLISLCVMSVIICKAANEQKSAEYYLQLGEKEAQQYQKWSERARGTGKLIGGAAGAVGGAYLVGARPSKPGKTVAATGIAAGTAGAAAGGYLGGRVAGSFAEEMTARYYARKYSTSRQIAEAALITGFSLENPANKALFISAEKRNTQELRERLSSILSGTFGPNWQEIMKNHTNESLQLLAVTSSYEAEKIIGSTLIGKKFIGVSWILFAIGVLYFNLNFTTESRGLKNRVLTTQRLMKTLFNF